MGKNQVLTGTGSNPAASTFVLFYFSVKKNQVQIQKNLDGNFRNFQLSEISVGARFLLAEILIPDYSHMMPSHECFCNDKEAWKKYGMPGCHCQCVPALALYPLATIGPSCYLTASLCQKYALLSSSSVSAWL